MCWLCDNPGATREDYIGHIVHLIELHGWAVHAVPRDGIHPPSAYTVGLTQLGLPELTVTGMRKTKARQLLDTAADHSLECTGIKPGDFIGMSDGMMIEVVWVGEPAASMPIAAEIFGPRFTALQLVHADYRGHWPWNTGYRGVQPVLGVRACPPASAA